MTTLTGVEKQIHGDSAPKPGVSNSWYSLINNKKLVPGPDELEEAGGRQARPIGERAGPPVSGEKATRSTHQRPGAVIVIRMTTIITIIHFLSLLILDSRSQRSWSRSK